MAMIRTHIMESILESIGKVRIPIRRNIVPINPSKNWRVPIVAPSEISAREG